jgi:hypothetical protein
MASTRGLTDVRGTLDLQRIKMALWSLFVDIGSKGYVTQVRAGSTSAAVRQFLRGNSLAKFLSGSEFEGCPRSFSNKHVFLFIPMDGLVNMYFCQFGRKGKYIPLTLTRTVSQQNNLDASSSGGLRLVMNDFTSVSGSTASC